MNNILVVGPAWVGDMVMAQSLFMTLKSDGGGDAGDVKISVLAPPWSMPILARMPQVSAMIEMPLGHGELKLAVRRRLGHTLRAKNFSQAIVLPGSWKSALVPWFAQIPHRTGYLGEQRWGLLNDIRRLDKDAMPMNVQRFVALAAPKNNMANVMANDTENDAKHDEKMAIPQPSLQISRTQVADTVTRFGLQCDKPIIAFCPGAEFGAAKRWPAAHFAEVGKNVLANGRQVWLFGSENDRRIAAKINHLCGGQCVDLSGRTSLGEAVDLMSLAQAAVTNDSGLMHIAAAIGCRVIAIYGSSSTIFTPPLTDNRRLLTLNLECSPCFARECPLGHLRCLRELSPLQVLAALSEK